MDNDITAGSNSTFDNIRNGVTSDKTKNVQNEKKKKRAGQWCSAINCKNNRLTNRDMSFFRFPKDKERSKRWVLNSRRQDLLDKSAEHLFRSNVLCANHFEMSQFTSTKKIRLKRQKAIPTLFNVPNPPEKIQSKRKSPVSRKSIPVKDKHLTNNDKDKSTKPDGKTRVSQPEITALKRKIDAQRKRIKRLKRAPNKSAAYCAKKD